MKQTYGLGKTNLHCRLPQQPAQMWRQCLQRSASPTAGLHSSLPSPQETDALAPACSGKARAAIHVPTITVTA